MAKERGVVIDINAFIGGFGNLFLSNIKWTDLSSMGAFPDFVFVVFQGTFAAIAVAIASGSMIERVKFSTFMVFSAIWILVVYAPIAHRLGISFLKNILEDLKKLNVIK